MVLVFLGILTGCTSTKYTTVSTIHIDPPKPRAVVWKPVTIKREAEDRYVMDKTSRTNLKDNLAETERYIIQQNGVIEFYKGTANGNSTGSNR